MEELGRRVMSAFPSRHFVYCFAYGSAVFRQAGRAAADDRAMVDMIFAVDDTPGFHRDNMARNPGHYSRLRHLGPAAVAAVQTAGGARVYFNTHVTGVAPGGAACKYGVIDARDLRRDLRAWRTLYVAGRLHKPVLTLFDRDGGGSPGGYGGGGRRSTGGGGAADGSSSSSSSSSVGALVARNLESAARAALLQLPGRFAERDLYAAIAGLSYRGDFRMIVGEDRNKVANIVRPQADAFRRLYAPALRAVAADGARPPLLEVRAADASAEQDVSARARLHHLRRLPDHLLRVMMRRVYGHAAAAYERDDDDDDAGGLRSSPLLAELAERHDLGEIVRHGICKIVFYPSLVQSIKGIPTAGLRNAVVYSYEKLNKMAKSMLL